MDRASWVLNRHLIPTRAALRSRTSAWTSLPSASSSGSRCFRQQRDSTLNSISAIFNQLPCRGVVELQPFRNPPGIGRWERLVQRRRAVGVEIVQDHPHHRDLDRLHPPASASGGRSPAWWPLGHRHLPPPGQRLAGQEQIAGAFPPVFVVLPQGKSRPGRQRGPGLRQQLGGGLVKADHRTPYGSAYRSSTSSMLARTRRSPWGCTTPASATA